MNTFWYEITLKDPEEDLTADIHGMGAYKQRTIYSDPNSDKLIIRVEADTDPINGKSLKSKKDGKLDVSATKVKQLDESAAKKQIEKWTNAD